MGLDQPCTLKAFFEQYLRIVNILTQFFLRMCLAAVIEAEEILGSFESLLLITSIMGGGSSNPGQRSPGK